MRAKAVLKIDFPKKRSVSTDYVRRLLRDGFLSRIKMPGKGKKIPIRTTKASVDEFILSHTVTEVVTPEKPTKRKKRSQHHGLFTNWDASSFIRQTQHIVAIDICSKGYAKPR